MAPSRGVRACISRLDGLAIIEQRLGVIARGSGEVISGAATEATSAGFAAATSGCLTATSGCRAATTSAFVTGDVTVGAPVRVTRPTMPS
jgi:hypothetical protein